MHFLQGLPVLVLGLGDSGLAMARWCAGRGFAVRVWDSREAPPAAEALKTEPLPEAQEALSKALRSWRQERRIDIGGALVPGRHG